MIQRAKLKTRLLAISLCMAATITSIPLEVLADTSRNHAPVLSEAYESGLLEKTITTDEKFSLNLEDVFVDEDLDELTYFVRLGNTEYQKSEHKCIYKPDSTGMVDLSFKANDGTEDSKELNIKLHVKKGKRNLLTLSGTQKAESKNLLSSLVIHTGSVVRNDTVLMKNASDPYSNGIVFDPETFQYELSGQLYEVKKIENEPADLISLGFLAQANNRDAKVKLHWGENQSFDITSEDGITKIKKFLSAGKNEFSIVVSEEASQKTQTYDFIANVYPTLFSLEVENGAYLTPDYEAKTKEYTLSVGKSTKELTFHGAASSDGCEITYNGKKSNTVNISESDNVIIAVSKEGVTNTYTIQLDRKQDYECKVETVPSDATVVVQDHLNEMISPQKENQFVGMFSDYEYKYTVSAVGYKTKTGIVPKNGGTIKVELEKVTGKQPDTDVEVAWSNFRNSDTNMAITSVKTPKSEDVSKITPKWIRDFTEGKPSIQIIVDNALVVMAGKTLYKLDLETGEVLQQAEMVSDTGYGYTPMTYAEGMIFCPLTSGTIQAFNAKTLESLWVYKNAEGGQSLSPITYSDGYIYTGFWKGEQKISNFVCISILDEDVNKKTETKQPIWTHNQMGGFYWAGAVTVGNAVIVGTDDGSSEGTHTTSYLYAFDKKNGEIISKITLQSAGDQRSSIAYRKEKEKEKEKGRIYFTTKGGYLYSAKIDEKTGKISDLKGKSFGIMSTSTPVVYKNRVYFGVGKSLSSGCFAVADANSLEVLFTVDLKGYPQCSMLLSNAYEESTGYLYLYTTYNNKPGGLSVIKVKPDCKSSADVSVTELYDADGYSQYCITSVICDKEGNLYYKNDSGNVFAIGIPSYENVIQLIDEIGQVTLESEGKIKAAKAAYNALSSADKQKVTNYKKLSEAEKEYEKIANANHVIELINAIGKVTLTSNEKLAAARKAYDLLTASEKLIVINRTFLMESEEKYDELVNEATNQVEDAIYAIGTVTIDSRSSITKARTLYEELPAHLKELISNLKMLTDSEETFKKLLEEQKNKKEPVKNKENAVSNLDEPTKAKVLVLQEKLENIKSTIDYEDAMKLMKEYYALNENGQLALKDMEELTIIQNVIATENHKHTDTGLTIEGVEWNIRFVVEEVSDQEVFNDVKQRVTDRGLLKLWDISLEDCMTGETYQPQDKVTIKIPRNVINTQEKDNQEYSILHYTKEKKIEIFNCIEKEGELVFDALEFSYYGIMSKEKEVSEAETFLEYDTEDGPMDENGKMPWYIWVGMTLAGILLLVLVTILKKVESEEEMIESDSIENSDKKG